MKYLKQILIGLAVVLVLIQFIRPAKNLSGDTTNDISKKYVVPADVQDILKTSCYDCHSNSTVYPWYAEIQPVSLWLNNHINEGKDELNFNEFATYRIGRQYRKLKKLSEEVKEDEMPLSSYTLIHTNARMTDEAKKKVIQWSNAIQDSIKAHYPADSLAKPKL